MRTASCTCGRLIATVAGDPVRVSMCHCLACQQRTGGVFAVQARFPATSVTITGASTEYVRTGDSGGRAHFHFCPTCGTTVYYVAEAMPDVIAIPVGVFMEPTFPRPRISVYEERKHAWVVVPEDIEHMQ